MKYQLLFPDVLLEAQPVDGHNSLLAGAKFGDCTGKMNKAQMSGSSEQEDCFETK